ncbi:selenoprotein Pb-like [Coregonus clupeaformis]|uniref:selenoprotein Pb-like n=1 Tax=Coregonus clupeaformis TaxID=59861 RepID=UPI001BDF8089|nr:selenoprotein Pb-like [Coregonus clupeaformis]
MDLSPLADRCGRLTFHIVLPYSFPHYPCIEAAVRATYHKDICGNCTVDSNSTSSAGCNSSQRNKSLSSAGMGVNETDSTVADTVRQIEVATVGNPAPTDGHQMLSEGGVNMLNIHHQQHQQQHNYQQQHNQQQQHNHQQHHNHHNLGSDTDKQDSN